MNSGCLIRRVGVECGHGQTPRIELPGAPYHAMSRGNERRRIVRDDADRQKWIEWPRRTVETHGWRLHDFVLMPNHHHLFVETPEANQ